MITVSMVLRADDNNNEQVRCDIVLISAYPVSSDDQDAIMK